MFLQREKEVQEAHTSSILVLVMPMHLFFNQKSTREA
jgi:hypothetical protein